MTLWGIPLSLTSLFVCFGFLCLFLTKFAGFLYIDSVIRSWGRWATQASAHTCTRYRKGVSTLTFKWDVESCKCNATIVLVITHGTAMCVFSFKCLNDMFCSSNITGSRTAAECWTVEPPEDLLSQVQFNLKLKKLETQLMRFKNDSFCFNTTISNKLIINYYVCFGI